MSLPASTLASTQHAVSDPRRPCMNYAPSIWGDSFLQYASESMAEQWRWTHNWGTQQHRYHGTMTFRLTQEHPGLVGGQIVLTFHTILILDLSDNNLFAHPHPLPHKEENLMDIDLPEDYVFYALDEDSDREFHPVSIPVYSPLPEAKVGDHLSDEKIVMTNFDQSEDNEIKLNKLMSDLDADDEDKEMESSEEEDPKAED